MSDALVPPAVTQVTQKLPCRHPLPLGCCDDSALPSSAPPLNRPPPKKHTRCHPPYPPCTPAPTLTLRLQYSFSNDASAKGRPSGFTFRVREARASVGAGFIVVICGGELLAWAQRPAGPTVLHSTLLPGWHWPPSACWPLLKGQLGHPQSLQPLHTCHCGSLRTHTHTHTHTHGADLMMIPGLPTRPAFYNIDLDLDTGRVVGLS